MANLRTDSYWPSSWSLVVEPGRKYLYHAGEYFPSVDICSRSPGLSPVEALARISISSYHNRRLYFLITSGLISRELQPTDLMSMLANEDTKMVMVDGKSPTKGYWLPNETGGWEFIYQDQSPLLSAMFRKYILLPLGADSSDTNLKLNLVGFWPIAEE